MLKTPSQDKYRMPNTYRLPDTWGGVENMGDCCSASGSCGDMASFRTYLTRDEKIEMLEEYKKSLELEAKGVAERIEQLKKMN